MKEWLKKQWSRKIIIGLYVLHGLTAIFIFTDKIPAGIFVDAVLWIFGIMVLGNGVDKVVEVLKARKNLLDPVPDKGEQ